jgi:hypothetical protein
MVMVATSADEAQLADAEIPYVPASSMVRWLKVRIPCPVHEADVSPPLKLPP